MNDLLKLVLAGAAIYGAFKAAEKFGGELDQASKTGLTLGGLVSLGVAGSIMLWRFENAADQTQALLKSRT